MEIIQDKEHFRRFIAVNPSAVVCFHSPFSAYSRRMVQCLADMEKDFAPIAFGSFDVDAGDAGELVRGFAIVALPSVLWFRGGELFFFLCGERSAKSLEKILRSFP
jgi:hypothetical protein